MFGLAKYVVGFKNTENHTSIQSIKKKSQSAVKSYWTGDPGVTENSVHPHHISELWVKPLCL